MLADVARDGAKKLPAARAQQRRARAAQHQQSGQSSLGGEREDEGRPRNESNESKVNRYVGCSWASFGRARVV